MLNRHFRHVHASQRSELFRGIEILGKEGRSAILREVAKGLQMPVDDVIPSKETAEYQTMLQNRAKQLAGPQAQPTPTQPDGTPKGGMDGNTVQNRSTGNA